MPWGQRAVQQWLSWPTWTGSWFHIPGDDLPEHLLSPWGWTLAWGLCLRHRSLSPTLSPMGRKKHILKIPIMSDLTVLCYSQLALDVFSHDCLKSLLSFLPPSLIHSTKGSRAPFYSRHWAKYRDTMVRKAGGTGPHRLQPILALPHPPKACSNTTEWSLYHPGQ